MSGRAVYFDNNPSHKYTAMMSSGVVMRHKPVFVTRAHLLIAVFRLASAERPPCAKEASGSGAHQSLGRRSWTGKRLKFLISSCATYA